MPQRIASLCGRPLAAPPNTWICGAASRHTTATISHTTPLRRTTDPRQIEVSGVCGWATERPSVRPSVCLSHVHLTHVAHT